MKLAHFSFMYIAVTKFSFYTLISLPVDGVQILAPHVDVDGVVVHAPQVHVNGVQILPSRCRMCTTRRRWAFKYEHHKYMLMVFKHVHHTAMLMAFWKTFCVQLGSKTTYDAFRAALEWPLWRPLKLGQPTILAHLALNTSGMLK